MQRGPLSSVAISGRKWDGRQATRGESLKWGEGLSGAVAFTLKCIDNRHHKIKCDLVLSLTIKGAESVSKLHLHRSKEEQNQMGLSKTSAVPLLLLSLLCILFCSGKSELSLNYYSNSCPRAEDIVKQEVENLYKKHGNTAVSWLRTLFHDCMVKSCDASLLLETTNTIISEQKSPRSFGMRNFKYIKTIKDALEAECPATVSCADIIALSARDGVALLGGPYIPMRTGRRDSKESYFDVVEDSIPNHNDSLSLVLSRFQSVGIDTEGIVALLGAHSVGRVHCTNLVNRLYPTVDQSIDQAYAVYLKKRCPNPNPDPRAVEYVRNDLETPMVIDNMYHKNLLRRKGLLLVDQQLVSDPSTAPFVEMMAANNSYFHDKFSSALLLLSENNSLTGDAGEVRKDCRFVNAEQ